MIKVFENRNTSLTGFLILLSILFWFSCTELGNITIEKKNSVTQDYCESVKITKAETGKTFACTLLKLKAHKSLCPNLINELITNCVPIYKPDISHFQTPIVTTSLYLYNRSFLI